MSENEQKTAIVFPGQGTQTVGMGKRLFDRYPAVRRIYEEADDVLGYPISQISFHGPKEQLDLTEFTQPAIITCAQACLIALQEERNEHFIITPNTVFAGQSLGEYLALMHAGAFDFGTMLKLIKARAIGMQEACKINPSGMISIKLELDDPEYQTRLKQLDAYYDIWPALFNDQIVLGGRNENLEKASLYLEELGIAKRPLNVAGAFHTVLMEPAVEHLDTALRETIILPLKNPVIANTTADDLNPFSTITDIEDELLAQMVLPVQWRKTLKRLHDEGYHIAEVGEHSITPNMLTRLFGGSKEKIILETGIGAAATLGAIALAVIWRHQTHDLHK